jgi:hypothetical protein
MKKFFLIPFCLGIILCVAGLAGCLNPFEPPEEASVPQGRGRVVVSIGGAANGSARTLAPAASEFDKLDKYTLTFSGPEAAAPVDLAGGRETAVELAAGSWTISAVGYMRKGGEDIAVAEGRAEVAVSGGDDVSVDIVLGPKTGGPQGTFSYYVIMGFTPGTAELTISTAEGAPVKTIPLVREPSLIGWDIVLGINSGTVPLDPGEYVVQIRIRADAYGGNSAGLTEVIHIYPGLTTTLPEREFTYVEFKEAFSDLDLTDLVTPPAAWATPDYFFENDQYRGRINWLNADGAGVNGGIFGVDTVYKAVVEVYYKSGYTHIGVAENSFTHSAATEVTNAADLGDPWDFAYAYVTITFPKTASPWITEVTVSPPSASVFLGGQAEFTASVAGSITPPQSVIWTMTGNTDAGTAITENGTLTVALNESSPVLTVTGASVADPSVKGTAAVSVIPTAVVKDISSAAELAKIGVDPAYPLGGKYKLTADLTLSDWVPIGNSETPFFGFIDGNGKTITLQGFHPGALSSKDPNTGQQIDPARASEKAYIGIFAYVKGTSATSKAELKDMAIVSSVNTEITEWPGRAIGLLTGYAENAKISGITLSGTFQYKSELAYCLGGIAGVILGDALVEDCEGSVAMTVEGGYSGIAWVPGAVGTSAGGFVGVFQGGASIVNCRNTGNITVNSESTSLYCGGIAGSSYAHAVSSYEGKIENCSYAGTISANLIGPTSGGSTFAGGIAGKIAGVSTRITGCRAEGAVSGTSAYKASAGGIVGEIAYGAITARSYFDGAVRSNIISAYYEHRAAYAGGIAGSNFHHHNGYRARIEDCWSGGEVFGLNAAGGIVGHDFKGSVIPPIERAGELSVTRCYSTAEVTRTSTDTVELTGSGVGGITGRIQDADTLATAVSGCAALNSGISTERPAQIHRVAGNNDTGVLSNNIAWSGMEVTPGIGNYTPEIGADKKDGANIASAKPLRADYEALGWDFNNVWKMGSDGYPELKWQN